MGVEVGIVVSVIALIVAVVGVYYNRRAVPQPAPKPELTIEVRATPLLPRASAVRDKVRIQYEDGGELRDPRLIQVILQNTGTAAIAEEMYDGQPFVVRLGTRVIGDLLREENSDENKTRPAAVLRNTALEIGPGAIHRNQRLTYALLVDGKEHIEHVSPLLNIDVIDQSALSRVALLRQERELRRRRSAPRATQVVGMTAALAAAAGAIGFSHSALSDPEPPDRQPSSPPTSVVTTTITVPVTAPSRTTPPRR